MLVSGMTPSNDCVRANKLGGDSEMESNFFFLGLDDLHFVEVGDLHFMESGEPKLVLFGLGLSFARTARSEALLKIGVNVVGFLLFFCFRRGAFGLTIIPSEDSEVKVASF